MWILVPSDLFARKFKKYQKKHPEATRAVLVNLEAYLQALNSGAKPVQIRAGFIHSEPEGVVAIDESGAKGRLRPTRLYIYAAIEDERVHLVAIGDKDSQRRDLADCRMFMKNQRKGNGQ